MVRLYGSPKTSAQRCFWVLEELGTPYERVALDISRKEHLDPNYLKLNPNGKVPCLIDGDFTVWESMAINAYLCETRGRELLGASPQQNALINQWSFWAVSELQRPLMDMLMQTKFVPEAKRDLAQCERARKSALPLLAILDRALRGQTYLVGGRFTLADANVASLAALTLQCEADLASLPALRDWLRACADRPAYQRVKALA